MLEALVDTGSQVTALSYSSYIALPRTQRPPLHPLKFLLTAANGSKINARGMVRKLPIQIPGLSLIFRNVVVVNDLSKDMIIGADLMKAENLAVDVNGGLFKRAHEFAKVTTRQKLKPHAEMMVVVKSALKDAEIVVEPIDKDHLICVPQIHKTNETGEFQLLVQNPTNNTVVLNRQENMGIVETTHPTSILQDIKITKMVQKTIQSIAKNHKSKTKPSDLINLSHLTNLHQQQAIKDLINLYTDVFSIDPNDIGHCTVIPQKIILKDESKVANTPPYRIAPNLQSVVVDYVDKLYQAGVIQKSTSPFCSPLLLVKKAGSNPSQPIQEQYRVVHDFRKLNSNSIRDSYPLHNLYDLIDKVATAKIWSVIDLSSGFWNQALHKDSQPYTAFAVPGKGHYEYNRTAQGLANSPAAFQRLLDFVVREIPGVFVYIDDVVIATNTFESHLDALKMVLSRFRQYNLKCRPKKIQIATKEINYLGYNLTQDKGIRAGLAKTQVIKNFKNPTTVKEIRQFLGLCSFFRRTIPDFATKAQPLTKLTRKDSEWKEGQLPDEARQSFEKLKLELISRPCLTPPDFSKEFILTVDASTNGLGAILSQKGDDSLEHPIAYGSRALSETEKKYASFRLEYLALLWGCKHFKPYLLGKRFQVRTDHKPLLSFNKEKGSVYDRYLLELSEFDFEMVYLPGEKMPADVLSRQMEEISSFKNQINMSLSQIKQLQTQDKFLKALAIYLKYKSWPQNEALQAFIKNNTGATINNGLLYMENAIFAPKGLQMNLIRLAHDVPIAGHFSTERTLARLKAWHWATKSQDVEVYCRSCPICLQTNKGPEKKAELMPYPLAKHFNERVHIDLLGPLPNNNGYKYILVMIDAYSRFIQLAPATSKEMEHISQLFYSHWISVFGSCEKIVSDNGKEFSNSLFKIMAETFGISQYFTSAYHPQANGMAERAVRLIVTYLRKYLDNSNDWIGHLSNMQIAFNTTTKRPTQYTPHEAVFGYPPNIPLLQEQGPNYAGNVQLELRRNLAKMQKQILDHQPSYFRAMKDQYDKRIICNDIRVDDLVYITRPHKGNQFQKFQRYYEGVFRVKSISKNYTAILQHTQRPSYFKTLHVNNLKLLPFLSAFPVLAREGAKRNEKNEWPNEKREKGKLTSLYNDDTVIHRPAQVHGQISRESRDTTPSSPRLSPSLQISHESEDEASDSSFHSIHDQISPEVRLTRSTRSRTGPLPEAVLHTYPNERKTFTQRLKNVFSPTK